MSASPWFAALTALFAWWLSTGAIMVAVRRADRGGPGAHRALALATLPVAMLGVLGLGAEFGPYGGFLSALALWGWIELAFLTGIVTGPSPVPYRGGLTEGARFAAAWGTVAWHEMLLTAGLAAAWMLDPHGTGAWAYTVLYGARISAKLNLFYGAPRINVEFVPRPLAHIPSHFRQGPVSWLFPVSILALSLAAFCWLERLAMTGEVGFALLASLTLLALLEHWLMVLPLPDAKLWRWMLPAPPETPTKTETRHGL